MNRLEDLADIYAIYQIYLLHLQKIKWDMNTTTIPTKRKIINLKDDTFKALSIMAIQHGTNLKNFIETTLDKIAENYDDEKLYAYLIKIFPDGKEPLNETPKKDFENWLGV